LRRIQVTVEGNSRHAMEARWKSDAPKSNPPPHQPPATSPPFADFPTTDMEVSENLVPDQINADITNANPMSFEDRLHEIDVEINYVPRNHGEQLPARDNHIEPIIAAESQENYMGQLNPINPPSFSRAPLSDISNHWATPERQSKPKTGSWKKKARSKDPITTTSPIILAEKRTNAEAFQATTTEVQQTKTACLFQNELLSVEARTQPRWNQ
jgi:hypothetical protein